MGYNVDIDHLIYRFNKAVNEVTTDSDPNHSSCK